jgi:hypothetical protein
MEPTGVVGVCHLKWGFLEPKPFQICLLSECVLKEFHQIEVDANASVSPQITAFGGRLETIHIGLNTSHFVIGSCDSLLHASLLSLCVSLNL